MEPLKALEIIDTHLEHAYKQGAFAELGKRGIVALETAIHAVREALKVKCQPCEEKKADTPIKDTPKAE